MKENTHTQVIPQNVLTQAQTKIQEVLTLLTPCVLALTPSERQGMLKMGKMGVLNVEFGVWNSDNKLTNKKMEVKSWKNGVCSFGFGVSSPIVVGMGC
jgi:hypothetical protein